MILDRDKIYLLDDEEGVRISLETILSAEGYDIKSFSCGRDLILHLQKTTLTAPAIALIDLRLPDMSGVDVMQKIKERSSETEVIMLTGNPDMTSAIDSLNAGAYAYILKPYNIDEIKNVMAKIFEKQRLVRENQELTQKMKEWNNKLESEVYQRTIALQESYRRLQILYQIRTQFVTIMSHELRTPTTALMGFADTLLNKWETLPKEKIQEYLNVIGEESSRMVSLMSEIFEISRIQEGKLDLQLEAIDLEPLIFGIVNEFRTRYPSYYFGFTSLSSQHRKESPVPDSQIKLKIDSFYFKEAISYIFMNSVKYAPAGGQIITFMEVKDGEILIRIEDDGPGIPSELRQKVFEPFFRSMDDVNRKRPGAGLGLTIAKGILECMQGTIRIDDKLAGGKGCAVVIGLSVPKKEKDSDGEK